MQYITISLSGIISWLAEAIKASGIISKAGAWIATLSITSLMIYGFFVGGMLKKIVSGILTVFLVLVALTFLSQAGALPSWIPFIFTW